MKIEIDDKVKELFTCICMDTDYGCRCRQSRLFGQYPSVEYCNRCEYKVERDADISDRRK